MLLTEEDVKAAKDVITSASVVVCQLEIKPEVTQLALSIAKKAGGKMKIELTGEKQIETSLETTY
jgi:sugar/nucleoside kinase (ribokinase family)